jgi:hypothetical protein
MPAWVLIGVAVLGTLGVAVNLARPLDRSVPRFTA